MPDKFRYNPLSGRFDLVNDLSLYATKEYVDSQIAGENHWDWENGVLTPYIANSSVNLGSGNLTTTGNIIIPTAPTINPHATNKEYVDLAISSLRLTEFLTADASDIATYYEMCVDLPVADTITSATLGQGNDQPLFDFATCIGEPGLDRLVAGAYISHIHIYKTGTRPVTVYYKLYKRTHPAGAETLLGTSGETGEIGVAPAQIKNIQVILTDEVSIDVTDRLVIKWYANVGLTGSNVTINIEIGGTQDSNFGININPLELRNILVPYTGAKFDVDLGTFDLTTTGTLGAGVGTLTSLNLTAEIDQIVFDSTAAQTTTLKDSAATTSKTITLPNFTGTLYISDGTDVAVADGGTGRSSNTAYALLSGGTTTTSQTSIANSATAGTILQSAGTSAYPVWSTATYPATTTDNQILYSTSDNIVGGSAFLTFDEATLSTLGIIANNYIQAGATGYNGEFRAYSYPGYQNILYIRNTGLNPSYPDWDYGFWQLDILGYVNFIQTADLTISSACVLDQNLSTISNPIFNDLTVDKTTFNETASFDAETDNGDSGSADTIDWRLGNKQKSTLTNDCTFTFTAPAGPCNLIFKLIQDGTGSRIATWPNTVKWPGGTAPTLTTTADAVDIVSLYYDGTNYYGNYSLNFL